MEHHKEKKIFRSELKPFLKWAGSKKQLINEIVNRIPEKIIANKNIVYVEPFVGSGAVLFQMFNQFKDGIKKAVISDINKNLINTYTAIKDSLPELMEELEELKIRFSKLEGEIERREFYLERRDEFNACNLSQTRKAALFIFLNKTCYNGLYRENSVGKFNVPFGRYENPKIFNRKLLEKVNKILQYVEIKNVQYEKIIKYIGSEKAVFYLDPPYKPISKTASFNAYTKYSFNDYEQERLKNFCDTITELGHYFILSNSDLRNVDVNNNYFDSLYKDYTINRVKAKRTINSKGDKRGEINELIITNENKFKI